MLQKYRLIWFQHFHKAAGSSIVENAMLNEEKLYPNHRNGNPYDQKGNLIKIGEMSKNRLNKFIEYCKLNKVTFVATEWKVPKVEELYKNSKIILITCLRDPLKRYVSNFNFDFYGNYTSTSNLFDYQNSGRLFTSFNYYCKLLLEKDKKAEIKFDDFKLAKSKLEKFDFVAALGGSNDLRALYNFLNWQKIDLDKKNSFYSFQKAIKVFMNGNFKKSYRYIVKGKVQATNKFKHFFRENNKWDIKLFRHFFNKNKY